MLKRILNKNYNKWLAFLYRENLEQIPQQWSGDKTILDFSLGKASTGYFTTADGLQYVTDASCVEIKEDGLHLYSKPFFKEIYTKSWEAPRPIDILHGWFDFQEFVNTERRKGYSKTYGTWVVKIKFDPRARPAIWLLKERHIDNYNCIDLEVKYVDKNRIWVKDKVKLKLIDPNYLVVPNGQVRDINYEEGFLILNTEVPIVNNIIRIGRDNITPETDLFELINGNIVQTVHYGHTPLTTRKYRKYSISSIIAPSFKNEYEVAVAITPKGYKFYVDKILTAEVWGQSSEAPNYVLCNSYPNTTEPTEAIVTEIAYYGL